ncbi:MAG: VanZ family protein [Phycisphaerae bacterium]
MNPASAEPGPPDPPHERWAVRALVAYACVLFGATHYPRLHLPAPVPHTDKWLHWLAYGLLAWLAWRAAYARWRVLSPRFVWKAALVLLAYAGFDEWTQQFANRSPDMGDWLADATGIVVVLAVMELRRRIGAPATS